MKEKYDKIKFKKNSLPHFFRELWQIQIPGQCENPQNDSFMEMKKLAGVEMVKTWS